MKTSHSLLIQQKSIANLRNKGVVPKEILNQIQEEIDLRRESLAYTAGELVKKLDKRLSWTDKKRNRIHRFLINLEVANELELLEDEEYVYSNEKLKEELSWIQNESEEMKRLKTNISSLIASIN